MVRVPDRIHDLLRQTVARAPNAEAIVWGVRRLTWCEVASEVQACARALLASGINKGDIVAMLAEPRGEAFITFLAAASIGAVWLGLNPRHSGSELQRILSHARPKLLFTASHSARGPLPALPRASEYSYEVIALDAEGADGYVAFLTRAARATDRVLEERRLNVSPRDPALLVYTSGTTGTPKGALLPHSGCARCAAVQYRHWGASVGRTRLINPFPISHIASTVDLACLAMFAAGTIIYQEGFDAGAYLKAIQGERVTVIALVPAMYALLLAHPDFEATDFTRIEVAAWGGGRASGALLSQLARSFADRLTCAYGSTETVGQVCFAPKGSSLEVLTNSIGWPVPDYEVRLADENGCTVPDEGEIHVRGDFTLLRYLDAPGATADAYTADGWLRTGDWASVRPDGAWTLVGRRDDAFKSGGYMIYPRDIELALESHAGVRQALLVSVRHEVFGEVGHAFVVCSSGAAVDEEQLQAYLRVQLARYKVPKRILFIDEMPLLPIGKPDKAALRARASRANGGNLQ